MRKKSLFLTLTLFLALCFAKVNAQTVYITDSGKKYHAKNCSLVKTGKKGIQLSEAIKQGYEPCKICKADAIKPVATKVGPVKQESQKSNK